MNNYIVKAEVVLHIQKENKEKAIDYAVNRVFDDLKVCFDDNDDIYIMQVSVKAENCTLEKEEEDE